MGEIEPTTTSDETTRATAAGPVGASVQSAARAAEDTVSREQWLRTLADCDNLRKRAAVQARAAAAQERRTLLAAFLDVLDSLDRALAAHAGERNEWFDGTMGIFRQTVKLLQDFGVEPLEALGQPFDPQLHEAVAVSQRPGQPDGVVMEVAREGYRMSDGTLLRPAQVVVNRIPSSLDRV
jgi:molecular chaperone GrpE